MKRYARFERILYCYQVVKASDNFKGLVFGGTISYGREVLRETINWLLASGSI